MFRTFETTLAGRPLVIETGKMAQLANGHCLVRYGDTVVMVNVTASRSPREGVDFFPLSVDYEEKLYSVGKIPGGYIKREGKPSEKAILTSRVIDRPIRPLFPSDLRNDVSVVATVLSVEQDNPPEVAAMIGTSIAISISDVPWNGPIGGVWLGLVDGEYKMQKEIVRAWLVQGRRVDGRGLDEIRPLAAEVDLLPRTHGSGMFTRGQTQVLSVATLAPLSEIQKLDGIDLEETKRYIHHYNFPSYSVGETRPSRGPGRREIGHGALAERSLVPVLPSEDEFPYAIRVVSEVLSSNGSTSQGSVCGSTLALMAAGVPIKAPVAGISCGLITTEDGFTTMVDIQGLEDFYGEMDFKVAGTKKGITSIQVDIKNDGLPYEVIEEALAKTRKARCYIIDEILLKAIPAPREELSAYAPKAETMKIDVDKIREVIGQGGKVIQKIVPETGAKIDIEEDGTIHIFAVDQESGKAAKDAIEAIVKEPEVGEIYNGLVKTIQPFGAFVEILPGKDGLCHISKLANHRVEKVEDVVKEGDWLKVKVMEVDKKTGKISLSHKDAIEEGEE